MDSQPMDAHVAEQQAVETFVADDATREYLGQWHRLVSTTNWEKGRIILEWRQALLSAEAPASEFSDDAWSRRVGNVSSQHVGRLRRTHERFGAVRNDYHGLYWSHFASAIEWQDAEMWLEGAVQSGWSVSQMRFARWEVLGKPAGEQPESDDPSGSPDDDDAAPAENATPETVAAKEHVIRDIPGGPDFSQGPDFGDEGTSTAIDDGVPFDVDGSSPGHETAEFQPFAHLPSLPDDLSEAFESFKLAIVRHKLAGWSEVSRDDVLATLDALKRLALTSSDD